MSAQENIIRLRFDASPAAQSSKQYYSGEKQRQKQSLSDWEILQAAKTSAARREENQRIANLARSIKTTSEMVNEALKEEADAAKAASKIRTDAERQAAKEKIAVAREATKEARELASQQAKAARDLAKERTDAERQASREVSASQRQANKEARDLIREQVKAARDAAREKTASERLAARESRQLDAETSQLFKQIAREQTAAAKQTEREKTAAAKQTFREWKQGMDLQHRQAMKSWADQQKGSEDLDAAIKGAVTSVAAFGLGMIGLSSAIAIISTISDNWRQIKQNVLDATNVLQGYRESLLELAALKGHMGQSGAELIDNLKFRAQTGQKQQDAISLQEAAIGVGGGAIDTIGVGGKAITKNINQDEFDKAKVFAGKFQAVEGGDARAYGNMVGSLPGLMGGRQDAESVKNQMGRMYEIIKPGGFSQSSGMKQFGEAAPYIKSGILGIDEAMALESMYSVAEPDKAGARLDQLVRGTTGALGKNRKVKGPEGSNNIGTATYLKGLGANGGMKPQQIAALIQADIAKAKADGGADFNSYSYLQSKGYGNVEDLNSILGFDSARWNDTYAPMLADKDLGKKGTAAVENRLATDQTFVNRRGQYAQELGEMNPGIGRENMIALQRAAYASLKSRKGNEGIGSFEETMNPDILSQKEFQFGYNRKLKDEASDMLEGEARKFGINPRRPMQAMGGGMGPASFMKAPYSDEEMESLSNEVRGKGGLNLQESVDKMVSELEKQTRKLDELKPKPNLGGGAPGQKQARP